MTHAALKDLVKKWRDEADGLMSEARKAHYLTDLPDKAADITRRADELSAALSAIEGEAAVEILGWNDNASPRLRFLTKVGRLTAGTILYTAPPPQQAELMALAAKWEADANGAGAYNVTEQEHGRILQSRRCASELRAFATHPTPSPGPQGEVVVTTDEAGRCVLVSRQDDEHRILSVIWEVATPPAHQPGDVVTDEMVELALAAWFEHEGEPLCIANYRVSKDENARRLPIRMASALTAALAPKEAGHG